jgi:hypothetical protein
MGKMGHTEIRTIGGTMFYPYSEVLTLGDTLVMYSCGTCGASVSWIAGLYQDTILELHAGYHRKETRNEK